MVQIGSVIDKSKLIKLLEVVSPFAEQFNGWVSWSLKKIKFLVGNDKKLKVAAAILSPKGNK